MPCKDCQPAQPRLRPEPVPTAPCPQCVAGHLRQAREIAASGRLRDRYRAYWHLAQAAAMAGNGPLKRRITAARQAWQRDGAEPEWDSLVDAATHL